jgi:hypothetical protein
LEDFLIGVHELDEKQYFDLKYGIHELRNNYATLFDKIQKNYEKINTPRSKEVNMF